MSCLISRPPIGSLSPSLPSSLRSLLRPAALLLPLVALLLSPMAPPAAAQQVPFPIDGPSTGGPGGPGGDGAGGEPQQRDDQQGDGQRGDGQSSEEEQGGADEPEPSAPPSPGPDDEPAGVYYLREVFNAGLPRQAEPSNLATPQAALELFDRSAREDDWDRAVQVLDLGLIPTGEQAARGPELARQLFYVLEENLGIDWEALPDRPDALLDSPVRPDDPLAGQPRKSLVLGTLPVDGKDITIRLQRVRVRERMPIWTFSPQTVENIPVLYERYGPSWIDQRMPEWALTDVLGNTALWEWLAMAVLLLLALGLVWIVRWVLSMLLSRLEDGRLSHELIELLSSGGSRVLALIFLIIAANALLSLPQAVSSILVALLMLFIAWLAMSVMRLLIERAVDRERDLEDLSAAEREEHQRRLTHLSVGRRVILFVLFLVACGLIIAQFESLRSLGISLVASAGVISVVVGFAAQPVLGNIIAGLQIALAKPIRIGDSVYYEEEWGFVEDITYTYVLIRVWDNRRQVVPLRYFISKPFENWTKRNAHLIKPIHLYADYRVDVGKIREAFDELLRKADDWDEQHQPTVEVVDATEETIKIRALASAKDATTAWTLHCRLREELLAFLVELEGGRYLPRRRVVLPAGREGSRDESPLDHLDELRVRTDLSGGHPQGPSGPSSESGAGGGGGD